MSNKLSLAVLAATIGAIGARGGDLSPRMRTRAEPSGGGFFGRTRKGEKYPGQHEQYLAGANSEAGRRFRHEKWPDKWAADGTWIGD